MKAKILKRVVAVFCAISMSTSFLVTSAGAVDTSDAEAAFSMQYMNALPKLGEGDFDKFSGGYERNQIKVNDKYFIDTLQEKKSYNVKYPSDKNKYTMEKDQSGEAEKVYASYNVVVDEIEEKKVYNNIIQKVEDLKKKVKDRTPDEKAVIDDIKLGIKNNKISKHYDMPYEMRLAKAIYRWVAKEIPYDHDSLAKGIDLKTGEKTSLRKPQDPLYVFDKKTGVCAGKANLLNLMMRLAGIPSVAIVSRTHVFNAVYLKDKTGNREGWTLIDATWGAPSSDKSLKVGAEANKDNIEKEKKKEKEKINKMIKGTAGMMFRFMRCNFAMYDEYAKKIDDMIYIDFGKKKKMNDAEIDNFNEQLAKKLNELNENNSGRNGFKLNKIKIFKDKDGKFLVEYETNVKQDEAEDFYKQVQEEFNKKRAKDTIELSEYMFTTKDFKELSGGLYEKIKNVNKLVSRNYLKQTKKYWEEFKASCDKLLPKYSNELIYNIELAQKYDKDSDNVSYKKSEERIKRIVDEMNKTINSELETLNQKYQYLVTFKNIDISFVPRFLRLGSGLTSIRANVHFNLPLENAIKAIKEQSQWSDMKEFFMGFYDKTVAFKYANENIIGWNAHKIEEMVFGNWFDKVEAHKREYFPLKINGVTYEAFGAEGKKIFRLLNEDNSNLLENVVISPDLVGSGMKFVVGYFIKSLVLKGDEIIDWSNPNNELESVDVTESKRYLAENGKLYERKEGGSKGAEIIIPKRIFARGEIKFIDNKEQERKEAERKEAERKEAERKEAERRKKIINEFNNILPEFNRIDNDFRNWRNSDKEVEKAWKKTSLQSERVAAISARNKAIGAHEELKNNINIEKAELFIKLATKAINIMNKFKVEYEKERIEKKYSEVFEHYKERYRYIVRNVVKKGIKVNWNELTPNKKDILKIKNELSTSFDIKKAEQGIKICEICIANMDKFIKEEQERLEKERKEKEDQERLEKEKKEGVNNANLFFKLLKDRINNMSRQIDGGYAKYTDNIDKMNEADHGKLEELWICLEKIQKRADEFDAIVINDLKLAENITNALCQVVFDDRYSEGNIGSFDEYKNLVKKYSDLAVEMDKVLDNIKSMIAEHKQQ